MDFAPILYVLSSLMFESHYYKIKAIEKIKNKPKNGHNNPIVCLEMVSWHCYHSFSIAWHSRVTPACLISQFSIGEATLNTPSITQYKVDYPGIIEPKYTFFELAKKTELLQTWAHIFGLD